MSVEIKRSKLSTTTSSSLEEILYQYSVKDELQFTHPQFYSFPRESESLIEYQSKVYRAKSLHLTPPLHKGKHIGEILIEHEYISETTGKSESLWVCFFMGKSQQSSGLEFPLKTESLDKCMSQCKDSALLYKSRNDFPVLICTKPVLVGPTVPDPLKGNGKTLYKELLEPDVFDVLSSIVTLQDSQIASQVEANPVRVSKKLFSPTFHLVSTSQEGFTGATDASNTWMECELLEENPGDSLGSYTVTSLGQNSTVEWYSTVVYVFQGFLFASFFGIAMPHGLKTWESAHYFNYILAACLFISFLLAIVWTGMVLSRHKKRGKTKRDNLEKGIVGVQVTLSILFGIWFFHLLGYYNLQGDSEDFSNIFKFPYLYIKFYKPPQ
jgi:hypothetical protein